MGTLIVPAVDHWSLRITGCFRNSYLGPVPTKEMQIPPPQFCSHFHETCWMCWNEWKINFPLLLFRVMVIFVLKTVNFRRIFTITRKIKIEKLIFYSIQHIAQMRILHENGSKTERWRRGVCRSLLRTGPTWLCITHLNSYKFNGIFGNYGLYFFMLVWIETLLAETGRQLRKPYMV